MSVTLSVLTTDPNLLRCELHRLAGQVLLQGEVAANAVGIGAYLEGEVLLRRLASSAGLGVDALAPPHESEALVYHARRLPVELLQEENTQPFRARRWLFAHDGQVEGFGRLRAGLLASLPEVLRRQVGGATDSEVVFALFLQRLRETGREEERLEPELVGRLLADVARSLARASSEAGAARTSVLNLVATNGVLLVAIRLGQRPVYYTRLEGADRCELCGVTPSTPETQPAVAAHRRVRSVVVASHPRRAAGWMELPEGATLVAGSGGGSELQVRQL